MIIRLKRFLSVWRESNDWGCCDLNQLRNVYQWTSRRFHFNINKLVPVIIKPKQFECSSQGISVDFPICYVNLFSENFKDKTKAQRRLILKLWQAFNFFLEYGEVLDELRRISSSQMLVRMLLSSLHMWIPMWAWHCRPSQLLRRFSW